MQITSKLKEDAFNFFLNDKDMSVPLPLKSHLRIHKVFTLDQRLALKVLSTLDAKVYAEVIDALINILRFK